jgi:hypothetical protein
MIPFRDLIIDRNKGVGIAYIPGKWAYAYALQWLRIADKAKELNDVLLVELRT